MRRSRLGNYTDAITTIGAGLAEYPNDDMLWNNKGYAQYQPRELPGRGDLV